MENSSFTHIRCLNCQNQYVVSARRSPGKHDSEFCSGECRCSFLAAGIETTYGGHNDQHNLPSPGRSRAITKTNSPPRTNASLHVDTSIFSANQSFEEFSRDSFEDSSTVSSPSSP